MGIVSEVNHISKEVNGECVKTNIDEILNETGSCGCLQVIVQMSTYYLFLFSGYHLVMSFFSGDNPPWTCISNNSSTFCNLHYNKSIPRDSNAFEQRCNLKRSEWTYTTTRNYSFVTEFDLVCDKTSLAALISASYYLGGVVSAAAIGTISDAYGRKPVLIVSAFVTSCSSIGSSYVTNIWQLFCLNLIRGASNAGCYYVTIIYQSEFSPPKYRSILTNILLLTCSCSFTLIDLLAYYMRSWRHLLTYATLPSLPILIVFFFLPESPRWLLTKGRTSCAADIMKMLSKSSGNPTSVIHLKPAILTNEKMYTYLDLVRNHTVRKLTLTIVTIWFVVPVAYYTIALQSSSFGGNMYEAFALSSAADLPAYCFVAYACNGIGRKKTTLGGLFISGILLGSMTLVPKSFSYRFAVNTTISFLARSAILCSFSSIFTWTSELFPTVIRSQGLYLCAIFDRSGCIAVPFITRVLNSISNILPFLIVCGLAIFASLVGLLLPETNNKPTREVYEDFFEIPSAQYENRGIDNTTAQNVEEQDV